MRTKVVLISLFLLITLAPATYSQGQARGRVVIGQDTDPRSLNPLEDNVDPAMNIYYHIFDPLVFRDQSLKVAAGLAVSWKNIDKFTWEFKLRQGVKFHSGEDFTADDVKFTLDWITQPEQSGAGWSYYMTPFYKESQIVDPYTIRIVTKVPDPLFISRMTIYHILPKDTFQRAGAERFRLNPVGTGPYKFVEWVKDDHVTVEANPSYWRGAPSIKTVVFRPIPDPATRVAGLQTGELDLVVNIPPERVAEITRSSNLRAEKIPAIRIFFFAFNTRVPPFNNVKLRQAINYAVNKRAIVSSVMQGNAVQRAAVASPGIDGYIRDLAPYSYDPARAKRLMAEAGFPNGFEFTLSAPRGRYLKDAEIAEAIAGQLAAVGIKANLWIRPWTTFWERYLSPAKKEFGEGAFMAGFGNPAMDGALTYFSLHRCGSPNGYYCSQKVDALLEQAGDIVGQPEQRTKVLQQIERTLYDEAAWIFLFNPLNTYGVNNRLVWKAQSDEQIRMIWATLK